MSYTGSKNANGIPQWIQNNTPYHERYFELFAGSGANYYNKRPAPFNWLNDLSAAVIDFHLYNACDATLITQLDTLSIIAEFNFKRSDFIYLDPPYPFISRRSGAVYYEHEMSDSQHIQLLNGLIGLPASVMIATKQNEIYEDMLTGWHRKEFQTADRRGAYMEVIYMNYAQPQFLHQYNHLGNGFTDRQRMKRKRDRFTAKINELPAYERHLFIQELITQDAAAVKHFLTMHKTV